MTTLIARGKVRELYELDGDLLMVASDRISTYDVVHPTEIPDKGKVLTGLSALWFDLTKDIVANHVISYTDGVPAEHRGRALRDCLGCERGGRRVAPLLREDRLDRAVAQSSRSYGKSVSTSPPSSVTSTRSSSRTPPNPFR